MAEGEFKLRNSRSRADVLMLHSSTSAILHRVLTYFFSLSTTSSSQGQTVGQKVGKEKKMSYNGSLREIKEKLPKEGVIYLASCLEIWKETTFSTRGRKSAPVPSWAATVICKCVTDI